MQSYVVAVLLMLKAWRDDYEAGKKNSGQKAYCDGWGDE